MQIVRVLKRLRQYFAAAPQTSSEVAASKIVSPPLPQPVPGASTRLTAVQILQNEPSLSATELAVRAGVTQSYANSLVRRRRPRPVSLPPVRAFSPIAEVTEDRARIMIQQAAGAGMNVDQIAEQLSLVPGEVEFALKISRLIKKV